MKNVLFIVLLFITPVITAAQGETKPPIDKRLYEVFDADFLERMQKETPAMLEYYNFFLDNVYDIQHLDKNKKSDYPEIVVDDLEKINILKIIKEQELTRDYVNQTIYKIINSDKMLILISEKELSKKFNKRTN